MGIILYVCDGWLPTKFTYCFKSYINFYYSINTFGSTKVANANNQISVNVSIQV